MASKEAENFYRLVSLLVDIGTAAIRRLFLKYAITPHKVTSVTQFLVQEQNTISRLVAKRILGPAQQTLLQPAGGQLVDPDRWDISLLCILLKNICPITQVERTEIDTVRNVRNKIYGHRASATIPDTDFNTHWGIVEASIKTIAQHCNDVAFENYVKKYIDSVKHGPLDIESTVQVLKSWAKYSDDVHSKLDAVSATLDTVSAAVKDLASKPIVTDHIFENLKELQINMGKIVKSFVKDFSGTVKGRGLKLEQTRILLEYKCRQPFVSTKQFFEAKSTLQHEGCVVISGKPGEGKTLTAYKIMESISTFDRCLRLFSPQQWDHVDTNAVDVILMDDIFGKHHLDVSSLENWLPVLKEAEACVKSGRLKVVLTSRQNVLMEAQHRLDELTMIKSHIIQLTSSELTEEEKLEILNVLLDFYNRDKSEMDIKNCCNVYKANIGFPYCCFLFAADKSLFELGDHFFERPFQFFKENLGALNKEAKVSLLFLFYLQGRCSDNDLKSSTKKKGSENEEALLRISDLIGVHEQEMSLARVREILLELSGFYVTYLGKAFTFAHNIVYECVALIHSERYPEEVIEHCTWNFIISCVVTTITKEEAKLLIDKDLYENLCSRFIKETLSESTNTKFYDVRSHKVMQTRDVCASLFNVLQRQDKLRQFLTREMNDYQGGFLHRCLSSKGKDERSYLVEEAAPLLVCQCNAEDCNLCWKCHVRNDTARGACFGGDALSYSLMLKGGITVKSHSILDACKGDSLELLKLVLSTVKSQGKFIPEEVPVSKALVSAKTINNALYEILIADGAVVMPLCLYDAVFSKNKDLVQHFIKELKANGKWDPMDFWLQEALQQSISFDNLAIRDLLIKEGLMYHRGCLLSAVQSQQLDKVKETVSGMKTMGAWQSADWTKSVDELKNMLRTGEVKSINFPTLADVGVSEALIKAKTYADKTIYTYLLAEGVQLTMETLPRVVATLQLDLIKEVVDELKEQSKWNPSADCCAKAIFQSVHLQREDIFNFLVSEGITCTMAMLPAAVTQPNATVADVDNIARHIRKFGNWNPNDPSMQMALTEAFKQDDKTIFEYLIQNGAVINSMSVLIAVFAQDIDTVSMYLQILKASSTWDPSDQLLNWCLLMTKTTSPEIYALLLTAGVGYSTRSLLAAAELNDQISMMLTINELQNSNTWKPATDTYVKKSLEFMCYHNNILMFNVLQKKGAKLTQLGIFTILEKCKSLFYDTGPENQKMIVGVPSLTALVTASLVKPLLVAALHQKAVQVYVRLIHSLEETGKLEKNGSLLHDALGAAIESGSALAYNIMADTGTKVTESIVLKLLQSVKDGFKIEFPERLVNITYRTCMMQCVLACINNGNIPLLEEAALLMKRNTLWCQDDKRIVAAIQRSRSSNLQDVIIKLLGLKLISGLP